MMKKKMMMMMVIVIVGMKVMRYGAHIKRVVGRRRSGAIERDHKMRR